jgi:hypothetical protein
VKTEKGENAAKTARIHIATYQTLGLDDDDADFASFLSEHYGEDAFSIIIIDECHRSAWGKWSEVLTRNAKAIHIDLTATPASSAPASGLSGSEAYRQVVGAAAGKNADVMADQFVNQHGVRERIAELKEANSRKATLSREQTIEFLCNVINTSALKSKRILRSCSRRSSRRASL